MGVGGRRGGGGWGGEEHGKSGGSLPVETAEFNVLELLSF